MDNMKDGWTDSGVPVISAECQKGMADFYHIYDSLFDEVQKKLLESVAKIPSLAALVKRIPKEQQEEQNRQNRVLLRKAILDGEWENWIAMQRAQGPFYANQGIRFREWFELVSDFKDVLLPHIMKKLGSTPDRLCAAIAGMNRYIDIAMSVIGEAYLQHKENRIQEQQLAMQDLSTPVLQLRDRLLLLPIIGLIDTARARFLTQTLLQKVRVARARVVVMDITGVPAVDSKVANHLLQTAVAVRLMGAKVIITGVSPEVAQALVVLGVDLSALTTYGDLQGGLEEASAILETPTNYTHGSRTKS